MLFSSDSGTLGCFRDAAVWVSYAVGHGEPAFLWLLVNLSETLTAGPNKPVGLIFSVLCPEGSATGFCD